MVNHTKTIENIKGIESIMKAIKARQDRAHADIKEWGTDTIYSPVHREKKITAIKVEFEQFAASFTGQLYDHAAAILEAETENLNAALDVNDSTFANALTIINGMGKAMPFDQQRKIAMQFRGDYPAEKCIAALYEKLGCDYVVQLTDFGKLHSELAVYISSFVSDADKTTMSYRGIEKTVNKMLDAIQSDYRVDMGVSEQAFFDTMAAAAGLKTTGGRF